MHARYGGAPTPIRSRALAQRVVPRHTHRMEYRTTILATGGTTTGIPVPDEVMTALGGGGRPKVTVTVGSYTFTTTVGSRGGQKLLPLSSDRRKESGLAAGDDVTVSIALAG